MLFVVWDFGRVKTSAACGIAPTLRTEREEWGTHFLDRVREIERLGHPPIGFPSRPVGRRLPRGLGLAQQSLRAAVMAGHAIARVLSSGACEIGILAF